MPSRDVQRKVDVTSKSDVIGVCLTLRYSLLWKSFYNFASKLGDFFVHKTQ